VAGVKTGFDDNCFYLSTSNGGWVNDDCDNPKYYICETAGNNCYEITANQKIAYIYKGDAEKSNPNSSNHVSIRSFRM
jgi:hypothetical protein